MERNAKDRWKRPFSVTMCQLVELLDHDNLMETYCRVLARICRVCTDYNNHDDVDVLPPFLSWFSLDCRHVDVKLNVMTSTMMSFQRPSECWSSRSSAMAAKKLSMSESEISTSDLKNQQLIGAEC